VAPDADRSIAALFSKVVTDLGTLVHQELRAAAAEMVDRVRAAVRNLLLVMVAALLAVVALLVLIGALVLALGEVIPMWVSALTIGGVIALAAYGLYRKAIGALRTVDLLPHATFASLRDHRAWAKEEVAATRERLASTMSETREHFDDTVRETREHLASTVKETREHVASIVKETREQLSASAGESGAASDNREHAGAKAAEAGASVVATIMDAAAAVRETTAVLRDARDGVAASVADTRREFDTTVRETSAAVKEARDGVAATAKDTHAHVTAAVKDNREQFATALTKNRRHLEAAVSGNRSELEAAIAATREQLVATLEQLLRLLLPDAAARSSAAIEPRRVSNDPPA